MFEWVVSFLIGVICGVIVLTLFVIHRRKQMKCRSIPSKIVVECPKCGDRFDMNKSTWWNLTEVESVSVKEKVDDES